MDALEYCFRKINSWERVRGSVDFYLSKISTDNQTNKIDVPVGYYFTDWYAFLC